MEPFSFASSSALKLPVSVRMSVSDDRMWAVKLSLRRYRNNLDGHQKPSSASLLLKRPDLRHIGSNQNPCSELYVTVQLWADSKPLTAPVQTPHKVFKNARVWTEWLTLPIDYATIPLSSQLAITIWDVAPTDGESMSSHAVPFGGTTIALFDKDSTLQKGRQRCHVHRFRAADGLAASTTPHILPPDRKHSQKGHVEKPYDDDIAELERLEDLMKKHEMGEIPDNQWLDRLVFRQIEQLEHAVAKKVNESRRNSHQHRSGLHQKDEDHASSKDLIDPGQYFLYIDFPRFDHPIVFTDYEYPAPPISQHLPQLSTGEIQMKPPPEIALGPGINEDTSDAGRLIRIFDPETGARDNPVENKYRRLTRVNREGVPDRDAKPSAKERDELTRIISYGPTRELTPPEMDLVWRFRYHLSRNKRALTKFIKSVHWEQPKEAKQAVALLPRWEEIDVDDALELLGPIFTNPSVRAYAVDRLRKSDDDELQLYLLQLVQALKFERTESNAPEDMAQDSSLAKFLISRAAKSMKLGNFLHWFLMVECDDHSAGQSNRHRKLFAKVEYDFMTELMQAENGPERRKVLLRQGELITVLSRISKEVRFSKEDRIKKIERLKKFCADPKNELVKLEGPLPLPLDPSVSIIGCFPEESNVFKSSLFPLLINFKKTDGSKYPVLFKTGDDLRQDQLVIQIIMLMDRLLRKENLDLKLSPYHILATASTAGAIEFVPSMPIASILTKYKGSLIAYLRDNNPDESEPLGVRRDAMDIYVKSCAGYCVITYLLGVGDRHLDNLLVAPDGHFFHADFGYILGRDPKPFAPLMKLSKEMIEGMGGPQSANYQDFKQYCFTAYTTLRKSSNLILNLFSLMTDANVPDIKMEPDKAVLKVQERFHPELRTEEEVIRMFESLMEDSISSMLPAIIDWTHGLAQRFRA